jgi:uncharacterized delta-60 repeat protein
VFIHSLENRRLFAVNLDGGFGNDGFATLEGAVDTREFAEGGFNIHVLGDDRVYGVGQVDGAGGRGVIALARWTAGGALDATFSGDGVVTTDIPAGDDNDHSVAQDIAVQADGKIVVAATTQLGDSPTGPWSYQLAVVRYNANGTLDNTFGTGGVVKVSTSGHATGLHVRVLGDGKIALAGRIDATNRVDALFARFNANGTPDAGLDPTGVTTYDSTGQWSSLDEVEVGPGGESYALATANFEDTIIRFTAGGDRDNTFTSDAALLFDPQVAQGAVDLTVQDDGKLLLSGSAEQSGQPRGLIARLGTDGALDDTFANGGLIVGSQERFDRTWVMPDGEIVALAPYLNDYVLHRFEPDGSPSSDPYWATGVSIHTDTVPRDVGVQSSGKLVLGGLMDPSGGGSNRPLGLARVTDKPAPFGGANPGALVLPGTAGDDDVTVNVGTTTIDVMLNGAPLEFARGSYTRIVFDGGDGNDSLAFTGALRLEAFGGAGNDSITGGDGGNWLVGGDGADTLAGGAGGDTIGGGGGDDSITAGAGVDRILAGDDDDTIDAGDDDDTIEGGAGNDTIDGAAGDDWIRGDTGNDVLRGGDDADILHGSEGEDSIFGEGGNDLALGNEGSDLLNGGAGSDRLAGDDGPDRLYGGDGRDFLQGNGGDDRLFGHADVDKLYGGGGHDTLDGGDTADFLWGHGGNDSLDGGGGTDRIFAHDGEDTLRGGHGTDYLDGGDGADSFAGHGGNDRFIANDGAADTLDGGSGDDEAEVDELLDAAEGVELLT